MTLREYRQSINLTQTEFGERLGVSAQQVSNWENGFRFPSATTIMTICETFSINARITGKNLFFLTDEDLSLTEEQARSEAKQHKKSMPSIFFGSYEMPDGYWQSVLSSDDEQELIENVTYHAQGRPWFVV